MSFDQTLKISNQPQVRLVEVGGNRTISEFVSQLTSRSSLIIAVYGSTYCVTGPRNGSGLARRHRLAKLLDCKT